MTCEIKPCAAGSDYNALTRMLLAASGLLIIMGAPVVAAVIFVAGTFEILLISITISVNNPITAKSVVVSDQIWPYPPTVRIVISIKCGIHIEIVQIPVRGHVGTLTATSAHRGIELGSVLHALANAQPWSCLYESCSTSGRRKACRRSCPHLETQKQDTKPSNTQLLCVHHCNPQISNVCI
jgi:hypothetical protein